MCDYACNVMYRCVSGGVTSYFIVCVLVTHISTLNMCRCGCGSALDASFADWSTVHPISCSGMVYISPLGVVHTQPTPSLLRMFTFQLIEAVVLPMTHKERFEVLGIQPPKGVLLYGAPGTGKTLLARACAAQTKSTFLKLAGPQLVQMFIGDGAKLVRDAFSLAKEKAPAIIFIDELDAIGEGVHGDVGIERGWQEPSPWPKRRLLPSSSSMSWTPSVREFMVMLVLSGDGKSLLLGQREGSCHHLHRLVGRHR